MGASVDSLRRAAQRNANFASDLTRARAEGRLRLEKLVLLAAEGDGRLALEALARRYPDDWGRRERIEQDITTKTPMVVTVEFDKPLSNVTDPAVPPLEVDDHLQPARRWQA